MTVAVDEGELTRLANSIIVFLPSRLHWPDRPYSSLVCGFSLALFGFFRLPNDLKILDCLRIESPNFLEKLEHIQPSAYKIFMFLSITPLHSDDNASWDMVMAKDLWDDKHVDGKDDVD
ncbi:hypothetical protein ZIOFF_028622 [Zingiber officinale]|uniref:Uncharacterized protein n=1 Tax=Zingiber officinale TaxID=94328 RepID=A0A8J5LDY9_ZINOF|nr:hypothetical protein ZIOFF_028622 [Zingiber officinale]